MNVPTYLQSVTKYFAKSKTSFKIWPAELGKTRKL